MKCSTVYAFFQTVNFETGNPIIYKHRINSEIKQNRMTAMYTEAFYLNHIKEKEREKLKQKAEKIKIDFPQRRFDLVANHSGFEQNTGAMQANYKI